jgi:DNA polymerase elongation subunit (family B)
MSATVEEIKEYLEGYSDQQYIVSVESSYHENKVHLIIHDPNTGKRIEKHKYTPFLWMKFPDVSKLYKGDRKLLKTKIKQYKIKIIALSTDDEEGYTVDRLYNGYKYLVKCKGGSYNDLIKFFKEGGIDIFKQENKDNFLTISPTEQFLIQTGKRLFKGMDDYKDVHRFSFDLETTGLDPYKDRIFQIGMKDNRGFQHVLNIDSEDENEDELDQREGEAITTFFKVINNLKPAIIAGYNSENFDWYFLTVRCKELGLEVEKIAKTLGNIPFYRKQQTVKLGAETEYYDQTHMWGYNITDVYHAVRRAQAINSSIKGASLKYITKYAKAAKPNRVYIQGDRIGKTYHDKENEYWLNDTNGQWGILEKNKEIPTGTFKLSGKDIVERYLIDDLWETEKVDDIFNQATYLLSKIIPTSFMRASTMGTAVTWKLLMLGWYYRSGVAIPHTTPTRKFIGGLSRLLVVGYRRRVVKFDFASLYPGLQLTHNIFSSCDVMGAQRGLLQYNYDYRNLYKELKNKYAAEGNFELSAYYDKKQLPIKILNNGGFGSISAPNIYPWGDIDMGEKITCSGRQYLRHMIRFLYSRGFEPLVGDSVTGDTSVYIKYEDGLIDILPISDVFQEVTLELNGQERDFSKKPYKILTKNGWCDIDYVYRHKTNKPIHRVTTRDKVIDCTSDHSLFSNGIEISPNDLKKGDKLDSIVIQNDVVTNEISEDLAWLIGFFVADGSSTYDKRKVNYFSKKKNKFVEHKGQRSSFTLNNNDLDKLERSKEIILREFNLELKIKDYRKSSYVYKLVSYNKILTEWFSENCYDKQRIKKIPKIILNSNLVIKKSFMDGFCAGDGWGDDMEVVKNITQKSKTVMSGIHMMLNQLDRDFTLKLRKDKKNIFAFNFGEKYPVNKLKSHRDNDLVWTNNILHDEYNDYVYDISANGTFICGIGGVIAHNTDGFNFSVPDNVDTIEYTSNGNHRFNKEGVTYKGLKAVVAEYNDKYMKGVMGLDIDEICEATINISRKNYADLIDGEVKLVGNSIKSKKMSTYISEFIDKGVRLLLDGKGYEFVNEYYETIEMIYNKEIPLSKIANKSRIKISKNEYQLKMKKTNKSGGALAKQAHMELVLFNGVNVDLGDTIYYVNTGSKKGHGDIQTKVNKITKQKEVIINCELVPNELIENDPNALGNYNVDKYLNAFNKRIKPLLVCFHPDVRDNIIVDNPSKRKYFTELDLELTSGYPYKEVDQDKLEELLTITPEELNFWNKIGVSPTYMFEEYGIEDEFSYDKYTQRSETK